MAQVEAKFVEKIGGNHAALREAILAQLTTLKEQLAGQNPSPIERLLVDRVVVCWLQLAHADLLFADARSIELGNYWQHYQDRAHRRYLSAVKMLAVVRRLAMPIQLDVKVASHTAGNEGTILSRSRFLPDCTVN